MPERTDQLQICNDRNIPLADFQLQFCDRCRQSDCTRSQYGKSKFDLRAQNWESDLFTHVSRMDPQDPRYGNIAAQRFLPILTGSGSSQAWIDPREERPAMVQVPVQLESPPEPFELELVQVPPSQPEKPVILAPPPPVEVPSALNTPVRPRQMIGGAVPKPAPPVLDPWQPNRAPPPKPGEQMVRPGATIKFED